MGLASEVQPIPLKFLSKEGQNSTLRTTIFVTKGLMGPLVTMSSAMSECL